MPNGKSTLGLAIQNAIRSEIRYQRASTEYICSVHDSAQWDKVISLGHLRDLDAKEMWRLFYETF